MNPSGSEKANNYGNRLSAVMEGGSRNVESAAKTAACAVATIAVGAGLACAGLGLILFSNPLLGASFIVGGVLIILCGVALIGLVGLQLYVGTTQVLLSPVLAANSGSIDPKDHEIRFRPKQS